MKVRPLKLDSHVPLLDGVVLLAGVWLLICPFALGFGQVARSNDVILGGIVTILAAIRFFGGHRVVVLSWIICVLGIWIMISPCLLGFMQWHVSAGGTLLGGFVVIVFGFLAGVYSNGSYWKGGL